jgi:molybdopterin converting factor subunit 1
MNVRIKLFAAARDRAGAEEISVRLPATATIADLRAAVAEQYPQLTPILRAAMFAVDHEYGSDSTRVSAEAEIACIPPVSGG